MNYFPLDVNQSMLNQSTVLSGYGRLCPLQGTIFRPYSIYNLVLPILLVPSFHLQDLLFV